MNQDTPNKNLYSKEKEEALGNDNLRENLYEEEEEVEVPTIPSNNNGKNEFRSKMLKLFLIVFIALIIILAIGFIVSLITKKDYPYSKVEDVMESAAIEYFKDHKDKLPKDSSETVEISTTILANNKYMKSLDKYLKDDSCSGKVSVEKASAKEYSYTASLSCSDYATMNFYQKIADSSNVVTDGFGIYYMNNEYVYRGSQVDNYVRFSDSEKIWRIVKVTNNNEVVLISKDRTVNQIAWDERYNSSQEQTSGINTFKNSNVSTALTQLYDNTLNNQDNRNLYIDETEILTKAERSKVVEFASCVAPRSINETSKDGSTECSITEKTKMSLLSVYDFLNASLDSQCTSAEKKDCQNYNYLTTKYSYWLANGQKEDNSKVYCASNLKYIRSQSASTPTYLRVVIHLSENAMFEKGKGTLKNPYVIR